MRKLTVEQELRNRGDCRHGLSGVTVKVPGYRGEFYVRSSAWEGLDHLVLTLNAAPPRDDPARLRPKPLGEFIAEANEVRKLFLVSMADVVPGAVEDLDDRAGDLEVDPPAGDVTCPASRCYLRSYWPTVGSRPGKWNEFNSKDRARATGVRIPGERRASPMSEIVEDGLAFMRRVASGEELPPTNPTDPGTPPGTWVRLHEDGGGWKDGKLALVATTWPGFKNYIVPGPNRWPAIVQANTCRVEKVMPPALPLDFEGWTAEFIEDAATMEMDPAAKAELARLAPKIGASR